jgi:hypothetical protein
MFLGLTDPGPLVRGMNPDTDRLVRGMDPDPDPIIRGMGPDPALDPDADRSTIMQKYLETP